MRALFSLAERRKYRSGLAGISPAMQEVKVVATEVTPFDRSLWREAFVPDQPPRFPCPACYWSHRGRLKAELSDLHIEVPAHVAQRPHLAGLFPSFGSRFRL